MRPPNDPAFYGLAVVFIAYLLYRAAYRAGNRSGRQEERRRARAIEREVLARVATQLAALPDEPVRLVSSAEPTLQTDDTEEIARRDIPGRRRRGRRA